MSRILVLGGYGGFGRAISTRLAAQGHEVLVAGRSRYKAESLCAGSTKLTPVQLDRSGIAQALPDLKPQLVVDASGPFQAMDLSVPSACIAAGVHYCDIADGRRFVCSVSELGEAARQAGVVCISGASSVPALSGAAVRQLASGMDRVTSVEIAISASNRAAAGTAVIAAILAQVGQPFEVIAGGASQRVYGWQGLQRMSFEIAGRRPLKGRLVALVDVPDIEFLPTRLAGRPAVTFRAGTELGFHNAFLWLLSWLPRWGVISSLAPFARLLAPLHRLSSRIGGDRSAMNVRVYGLRNGRRLERSWTLLAENGIGPEIPALTVPLVAAKIFSCKEPPGARDAGMTLSLQDYDQALAGLPIDCEITETAGPEPIYRRVLGERFDTLPSVVRRWHEHYRDGGARGEAAVETATNPLGALIGKIMRFPRAGRHDLHVHLTEDGTRETWTRRFGERSFSSTLAEENGALVEKFGPLRFYFRLDADTHGITMNIERWSFFRFPLPLALAPQSLAREWQEDGCFHFDVPIALPLIGRVVRYRGTLAV